MQVISIPLGPAPLVRQASAPPPVAAPPLDLQARTADAAALLKALAHPDRLMLLCQLVGGERSVNELGAVAGVGQPSLSQQLGVLRGERLVATRREGKHVVYRIASPAALALLHTLHGLFCAPQPAAPAARPGRVPSRRNAQPKKDAV